MVSGLKATIGYFSLFIASGPESQEKTSVSSPPLQTEEVSSW